MTLTYDISAQGKQFSPTWGLDQAAILPQVLKKGLNHMGLENIGIGRTSFRVLEPLKNDTELTADMIEGLQTRANNFKLINPELPLVFNCDNGHEPEGFTGPLINTYYTSNKRANVDRWAAVIAAHVDWMKANTKYPIIGVSPFNEPDNALDKNLVGDIEGTPEDEALVAQKLKSLASMNGIIVAGGNSLNDDVALDWYNPGKQFYDWGNTHQLAGSFANFANFYQQLSKEGKVGYDDEMHNVVEAMVGLEYGMSVGIWWHFDSRARGEFCQISRHGQRLAYGEHRNNWTAASVWRHDDGRVKAFIGGSERQAVTTNYQFISRDRLVYYDGYGPYYEYSKTLPGGKAGQYQQPSQVNAECVIDITWGEDVPVSPVTAGVYRLVNKSASVAVVLQSDNIALSTFSDKSKNQLWNIMPSSPYTSRYGGDFSFYDITSATNNATRMNVLNFATSGTANVFPYAENPKADSNEQWYLEYAGDSFYYIRNRESALYLATSGGDNVVQSALPSAAADRISYQWRLIPDSVTAFDRTAPSQVTGLTATPLPAAVALSWTASTNKDLSGYIVVRAEKGSDEWNTIGRMIQGTTFTDNTCRPGVTYIYKVKAVDLSQNRSRKFSDEVECAPTGQRAMVAQWQMNENLDDATDNMMDARLCGTPSYQEGKDGTKALWLNGNNGQYLQLPYEVASSQELTVSMWVQLRNNTAWQRLFDFGFDSEHYMFLTPTNGNYMRFAIKNGSEEQVLNAPKLATFEWKHVVLTIGADKTAIYIDGEQAAASSSITIRPSDVKPCMNYIGRSQFVSDPLLNAFVDDVRIYNYAVTADDVKAIMAGGQPTAVRPVVSPSAVSDKVFNLNGVQRTANSRGVVISGGRKVLNKK